MRLRLIYSKTGLIRFISHRDLMRLFYRAAARSGLPLEFSRGFNPHPRMEFCPPLSVGMEGFNEILDLRLEEKADLSAAAGSIGKEFPAGLALRDAFSPAPDSPSLGKSLETAAYRAMMRGAYLSGTEPPGAGEKEKKRFRTRVLPDGTLVCDLDVVLSESPRRVLASLLPAATAPGAVVFWQRLYFHGPGLYSLPPEVPQTGEI